MLLTALYWIGIVIGTLSTAFVFWFISALTWHFIREHIELSNSNKIDSLNSRLISVEMRLEALMAKSKRRTHK